MKSWVARLGGSEFKVMRLQEDSPADDLLDTPERVFNYVAPQLSQSLRYSPDVENFGVVFVNTRRRAIGLEIVSNGTLDVCLVHPREVFRSAIVINAAAIILFHNHPSGDPCPSQADVKVTGELIKAGQLIKIECLDHIVIGRATVHRPKAWASLREMGVFYALRHENSH